MTCSLYVSGRFETQSEIRQFLLTQPEFPKTCKGDISFETVKRLLAQPVYAGMIHAPSWGISLREGKHEGLISYGRYLEIQAKRKGVARIANRIDLDADFILRGAVNCGDCGKSLTACWSQGKRKKYPYYSCFNKECASSRKSIARATMEGAFEGLLQQLQPTQGLFKTAAAIFKDLWDYQGRAGQGRIAGLKADLVRIQRDLTKLVDKMIDTDNDLVMARLEERIAALEKEKRQIAENIENIGKPVRPFEEMFEHAMTFLANPYAIWENGKTQDKRMVLKLAFAGKLHYTRNEGFRTPKTTIPFKLLGDISGDKKLVAVYRLKYN